MRFFWFLIIIIFTISVVSCSSGESEKIPGDVVNIPNTAEGNADLSKLPQFEFKEKDHDFGRVIQGEIVSYSFKFKNTGGSPLVISNISASCGCTATSYPKEPIMPGDTEFIKVTFDSNGRKGFQYKTITVASNTQPNTNKLSIKAEVVVPESGF